MTNTGLYLSPMTAIEVTSNQTCVYRARGEELVYLMQQ